MRIASFAGLRIKTAGARRAQLQTLAQMSADPAPAVTRVVYSPEDVEARTYIKSLMREAGLTVRCASPYEPRGECCFVLCTCHINFQRLCERIECGPGPTRVTLFACLSVPTSTPRCSTLFACTTRVNAYNRAGPCVQGGRNGQRFRQAGR